MELFFIGAQKQFATIHKTASSPAAYSSPHYRITPLDQSPFPPSFQSYTRPLRLSKNRQFAANCIDAIQLHNKFVNNIIALVCCNSFYVFLKKKEH